MDIATFIHNISEQKKRIAIGSSAVIGGLAILVGYFQSGPTAADFAKAEGAFTKWEAAPQDEVLYDEMKKAMQAVPALRQKYEAVIAQKLLNTEKLNEAVEMANRSLNRVKEDVPFHAAYAQNSLLIEQKNYQKALENAVALKEQMGHLTKGSGSLLYAHNLLRIACLQQELKNRPGEKAAWDEFESFLGTNEDLSELVLSSFSEKNVDLTQYIAERKKSLN